MNSTQSSTTKSTSSKITKAVRVFPKTCYTNDEFIAKFGVETTSEWIETMTGIKQRYFVENSDEFKQMIIEAAKKIADGVEIDAIIVASSTSFYKFPGLSQIVHEALGLERSVYTLDLNAACNGFMQALYIGQMLVDYQNYNKVLIIGADAMSSILNLQDRSTCCLFGDGVGAVLLEKTDKQTSAIWQHATVSNECALYATETVVMNGRNVFENSIKVFDEIITNVVEKNGLTFHDIDLFVLHQANYRIFKKLSERMQVAEEKMPFLAYQFANTSAATIPITLSYLDFAKSGNKIVLAGFGAGFTASATLISYE